MIQVIERAFKLLGMLRQGDQNLVDLARQAGLSAPATRNILKTLESVGAVGRNADGRGYTLGRGLLDLAKGMFTENRLAPHAESAVTELAGVLRESATLAVFQNGDRRILAKADGDQTLMVRPETGEIHSPFEAATGLILTTFGDANDIRLAEKKYGVPRTTQEKEITQAKKLDLAVCTADKGQLHQFAVPIRGPKGELWAALGVAVPTSRLSPGHREKIIRQLKKSAALLSEKISH